MADTHTITRPGMASTVAEFVFACPNFWVFLVDGQECVLAAKDGAIQGFTVKPIKEDSR
jgi:hypothetical protein